MKRLIPLIALVILALAAVAAFGQDDIMILNSKSLGSHERPLVKFTHATHSANIECKTCHHDFDENFNNTGSDGVACSECHGAKPTTKNRVSLANAFHKQCKDCHQLFLSAKRPTGPMICGGCHVRPVQGEPVQAKK